MLAYVSAFGLCRFGILALEHPRNMWRNISLLVALAAICLLVATPSIASLRMLQQSEMKVCKYACGMGMACVNGVCTSTAINNLADSTPQPDLSFGSGATSLAQVLYLAESSAKADAEMPLFKLVMLAQRDNDSRTGYHWGLVFQYVDLYRMSCL